MTSTISLSIERILDSVYAHSAAEVVSRGVDRPELLGRDHAPMLRTIARDVVAQMSIEVSHLIADTNIAEQPVPDIICLDMRLPDDISLPMLRSAIETAVASGVLAAVWRGCDGIMFDRYMKALEMSLTAVKSMTMRSAMPRAIAPTA